MELKKNKTFVCCISVRFSGIILSLWNILILAAYVYIMSSFWSNLFSAFKMCLRKCWLCHGVLTHLTTAQSPKSEAQSTARKKPVSRRTPPNTQACKTSCIPYSFGPDQCPKLHLKGKRPLSQHPLPPGTNKQLRPHKSNISAAASLISSEFVSREPPIFVSHLS